MQSTKSESPVGISGRSVGGSVSMGVLETPTSGAISRRKDQQLFKNMFGPRGVVVSDRKLNDKVLTACCVGNEVVDWLVKEQKISRREAVAIGQTFVDKGLLVPADDQAPMAFEDKFSFFRKTQRGDAIASHAGSSRGERAPLRVSRGDDGGSRSPLPLSPRLGRDAPSDEDASALGHLLSALAPPPANSGAGGGVGGGGVGGIGGGGGGGGGGEPPLMRKSPKAKKGSNVSRFGSQTPVLTSGGPSRHSSVMVPQSRQQAERMPMDLGDSTGMLGLLAGAVPGGGGGGGGAQGAGGAARKGAASEWRKSSMQASPAAQSMGSLGAFGGTECMEGWLHKQSSRDPSIWKRRYLVLRGGKTVYSREQGRSDAEIPMDVVGSVRMAPEAHALAFCIDAVTRSFVLRAETRDELNAWVFAYHKAALLVLDLLTEPGHVPRESRLRLQKWWKSRSSANASGPAPAPASASASASVEIESTGETAENGLVVAAAWTQGKRPTMEDAHLLLPDLREELEDEQGETVALFGVFDGHGGARAALLARGQLLATLGAQPLWGAEGRAPELLRAGMLALDARLCAALEAENDRSGSCAVVALLRERTLAVAHCGDCRALLFWADAAQPGGAVVQCLTQDHRPDRPDERARVEAAGGFVTTQSEPDLAALHRKTPAQLAELQRVAASSQKALGALVGSVQIARVMGSLAVSRSLGDVGFKRRKEALFPNRAFSADLVSAEPEVAETAVPPGSVLVLACDGLWDVLKPDKVAAIVLASLRSGKSVRETATALVERAMRRGTMDNVTLVIVQIPLD